MAGFGPGMLIIVPSLEAGGSLCLVSDGGQGRQTAGALWVMAGRSMEAVGL